MRGSTAERMNTSMKTTETTSTTETAAVAEQGAPVAPEKANSKKGTTKRGGAPKAKKTAKEAKTTGKKAPKAAAKPAARKETKPASKKAVKVKESKVPREFSKKAIVLDLLRRPKGATLAEVAKATDWQNHSIRGFISGNLTKKMGLTVESTKNEAGERTYPIAK
jgi:hypothetical protein